MANMTNNQPTSRLPYDYYADEEEEDIPAPECELASDDEWRIIQKNTFTRWANVHLKAVNKQILDLETDLSDGLRLLGLIEVLSGHKFHKYNRRPNFRTQKLENVTMVLQYLQDDQGIRIVDIDSTDIVDNKLKVILSLIWNLILHYSIALVPPDESYLDPAGGKKKERTPKQNLLGWVQSKIPDRPIKNFTSDWNDGTAIGALVDALAPGLCPAYDRWNAKNVLQNATEAMDAAELWLNIPQVLQPDEITHPKVDELSVMTYLAQFPPAKLKLGAPLRPSTNGARVRAYGPGIEPTRNCVGAPARFTVETFSACRGELEVTVLNPKGQNEQCDIIVNKDRTLSYTCVYTPTMDGVYRVLVKFANQEIPNCPFNVKVEGAVGDSSKVMAKGPCIKKTGVMVNKPTLFEVFTQEAEKQHDGLIKDIEGFDKTGAQTDVKNVLPDTQTICQEKTIQNIDSFDKSKLQHTETVEKVALPAKDDWKSHDNGLCPHCGQSCATKRVFIDHLSSCPNLVPFEINGKVVGYNRQPKREDESPHSSKSSPKERKKLEIIAPTTITCFKCGMVIMGARHKIVRHLVKVHHINVK